MVISNLILQARFKFPFATCTVRPRVTPNKKPIVNQTLFKPSAFKLVSGECFLNPLELTTKGFKILRNIFEGKLARAFLLFPILPTLPNPSTLITIILYKLIIRSGCPMLRIRLPVARITPSLPLLHVEISLNKF